MRTSPWLHSPVKRGLDVAVALTLLLLLWPLMLGIALGIWAQLRRPVLFRQPRPGRGGVIFTLVKFRTLAGSEAETERPEGKIPPTAFTTFLRRSGLDELPELWNILLGDMSFVGPRPLLTRYLPRYTPDQARRHEVRPGLTGWAQVHGRNALDWPARLALDVWYVEHASWRTDLEVLGRTLRLIGKGEGIAEPGEFRGGEG